MSQQDIMCEVEISDTGMVEVVDDSQFNDLSYNNYEVGVDEYEDEEICETDDQALIMQRIDEGTFYTVTHYIKYIKTFNKPVHRLYKYCTLKLTQLFIHKSNRLLDFLKK